MAKSKNKIGTVGWFDLTVPEATTLRDFYASVTGWQPEPLSMGKYDDYVMKAPGGGGVAGICHARGPNKNQPPQWMIYITVADLTASLRSVRKLGGKVLKKRTIESYGRFAVIQDPAGAVASLFQPAG